ncbi:hypothetical protein MK280_04815, partial [Myxococcota bacterium]|nr:hypothetical protein [Myxococcota bacterium]
MMNLLTYILTCTLFAAVGSSAAMAEGRDSGDSRSRKCSAELKRAGGDRAHCLLDAEARFQKTGNLNRLMKKTGACDRRFDRAFDRALQRYSDTDCVTVSKAELMNETDSYVGRYSNTTEGIANDPLGQSGSEEVKGIFHRGANPYIPDDVTHVALFNGGTTGGLGSASGGADVSSWFASCNKGGGNQFENIPEGVKQYITVGGGGPQFLPVWADVKELADQIYAAKQSSPASPVNFYGCASTCAGNPCVWGATDMNQYLKNMDGIVFDLEEDIAATTDLTDVLAHIKSKGLEVIATIAHDANRPTLPNVREVLMKEGSVDMVIPQVYDASGN